MAETRPDYQKEDEDEEEEEEIDDTVCEL